MNNLSWKGHSRWLQSYKRAACLYFCLSFQAATKPALALKPWQVLGLSATPANGPTQDAVRTKILQLQTNMGAAQLHTWHESDPELQASIQDVGFWLLHLLVILVTTAFYMSVSWE
jgi:hypothetical protein